jgi:hypothetical protein
MAIITHAKARMGDLSAEQAVLVPQQTIVLVLEKRNFGIDVTC